VLGDRRRILRAIAEVAGTASGTPYLAATPESKPRDEAERRQVTVMFSDLIGSTALSVRMDPEDLREVISAYQKCVAETVSHFGGFVARCVGGGVLVYFGYPRDVVRKLALEFLALASKQSAAVPLMIGHRLMGLSLLHTGDIVRGRVHLDRAITPYDSADHRPPETRFGRDVGVAILSLRSMALWLLGYPEAALADTERALKVARGIGDAATLMYALTNTTLTHIHCGNYAAANAQADESVALAAEEGIGLWKGFGLMNQGQIFTLTSRASDAVQMITSAVTAIRSRRTTVWMPLWLSYLTRAYAELGRFDDARPCIGEAMAAVETTKEMWCEAEVNRIAGEIALLSPERDVAKAETYLERALAVARKQQAKSRELRAAMSMARLSGDQGRRQQARDLLASVYGWFTQGFNTLDMQETKRLLDVLAQ
jgi:predicted ATPase